MDNNLIKTMCKTDNVKKIGTIMKYGDAEKAYNYYLVSHPL